MPESSPSDRDDFIRVATLDELKARGMMVVRGERCPLLVVHHCDRVFAVDNRCPHLGFPLHRGSIADGILTCHWHHARFDLASGGTFDLWADDVPTAAVELRDGVVWVARRTRHADGEAHWRNRLRAGLEQNIGLVIAKAVLGLVGAGVDHRALVREAALFGARHRDGWGTGLTIMTALANLMPFLPDEERYLALYKGLHRIAVDCDGASPRRDRQPLGGVGYSSAMLDRWLRHWTRARHRDGAERTLLTAIAGGASASQLAALMLTAVSDRYFAGGGHALDFINKAFECLDTIGWDHAAAILPTAVGQMVDARGAEESNAWRHPVDLVALCESAFVGLPAAVAEGESRRAAWRQHAALAHDFLGDDPVVIVAALQAAIRAGAAPTDLGRAVAYAAALRVAQFGTSNEHSDWVTAHHCFTYCNAAHQMLKRIAPDDCRAGRGADLLRCVFHGVMRIYLIRFLNVPPDRLPMDGALNDLPQDASDLCGALLAALDRHGEVAVAGRLVARYLALGHPAMSLLVALARAVLREDADFHSYQMLEAGLQQAREWGDGPEAGHILVAVARYLAAHSPSERSELQTATVALRLARGQVVHQVDAAP